MTDKCNPLRCPHYSAGWCEYDIATGRIYPNNAGGCPMEEDNRMTINEYQQAARGAKLTLEDFPSGGIDLSQTPDLTVAGVPLEEILQRNIDKLMGRYPQGFDPERSLHREAEA